MYIVLHYQATSVLCKWLVIYKIRIFVFDCAQLQGCNSYRLEIRYGYLSIIALHSLKKVCAHPPPVWVWGLRVLHAVKNWPDHFL